MKHKIDSQLDAMFVDMASGRRPSPKTGTLGDFRVSSFPFCPLRELLFQERNESFGMGFYTSIGTAVHETVQRWLARGGFRGKIFACWKCPTCNKLHGPCFKPEACDCGSNAELAYEEITISYRGLSGHVDLVVELLPGRFVVVDFKTTDIGAKRTRYGRAWRDQYPASRNSIIQISTYSTLLQELYGLNVVAWCLVYVDRGKSITSASDFHKVLRPWNKRKHKRFMGYINRACENNRQLRKLDALIRNNTGLYSPKADSLLKHLVKHRPCTDEASYDAWMRYKFWEGYSKNPEQGTRNGTCVLKQACCTSSRRAYEAVQKLL